MPTISPAINIGIGNYGARCMVDLANNFCLRESQYVNYVSFHQLNLVDGKISMNTYNEQSFKEYNVNPKDATNTEQELHSWQLHNFISTVYNSLITLTNRLGLNNVNFHAIQINLIFSAYEIEHLELVKDTILLIDKLRKQGSFGQVQVKCFSILSDGNGVSSAIQEKNIVKTLDSIVEIRNNYNILSHNFILDDKNTHAVALNAKNNYHAFAITEIIVALIKNEYKMLGSLPNKIGTVSIGMSMVYFDIHYFNAFIKNRILESKIKIEKIDSRETKIATNIYSKLVQDVLVPYIDGEIDMDIVIKEIQETIKPANFQNSLSCYQFLLTNILGEHDRVPLVEPIEATELYSIDDLIYNLLYKYVITDGEKETLSLLELKTYKERLTVYNAKILDGLEATLPEIEEEQNYLNKHLLEGRIKINHYSNKTWISRITPIPNINDITSQLEHAKRKLIEEEEKFENKNFILKYLNRHTYVEQIENTNELIQRLLAKKNTYVNNKEQIKSDLYNLYQLKENVKNQLEILDEGIDDILSLKKTYQKEFDSLPYLDYEFLHNIISIKKLELYEKEHREDLQSNIVEILNMLFIKSDEDVNNFTRLLDDKIIKSTNRIINFKMINHLLKEYDKHDLLKPFDFPSDIENLKHSSLPFFNAVPTYTPQSHYLKYFNDSDKNKTTELEDLLKNNYAGSLPTTIHANSTNKFALITVEVIEDLKSIVKYNNHYVKVDTQKHESK